MTTTTKSKKRNRKKNPNFVNQILLQCFTGYKYMLCDRQKYRFKLRIQGKKQDRDRDRYCDLRKRQRYKDRKQILNFVLTLDLAVTLMYHCRRNFFSALAPDLHDFPDSSICSSAKTVWSTGSQFTSPY